MNAIAGIVAGVITWVVVGSIPNMLGNFGGWAALFVLIIGPAAGFGVGGYVSSSLESAQQRMRAQEALEVRRRKEQEALALQQRNAQEALAVRLTGLVASSTSAAATLPQLARDSERALDTADQEFEEGAFAPFWDAVETAANRLAAFNNTVEQLVENATFHRTQSATLNRPVPRFQLGVDTLPDATHTADRMRSIVRKAQKSFQFATIYEQRKTNHLLVAGFTSLGHAISDLGGRLERSLENLSSSLSTAISDVATAQRESSAAIVAEIGASREESAASAAATREHQQRELEMLDNIQRRRKPRTIL